MFYDTTDTHTTPVIDVQIQPDTSPDYRKQHGKVPHWLLRRPRTMVWVFVGLTILCIWGNIRLQKGSVMDDHVIVNPDDPMSHMHHYVLAKQREGFDAGEAISFILHGGLHARDDLAQVEQWTKRVEQEFGEGVLSLAKVSAYQDTGESLRDEPYITPETLASPTFDIAQWQTQVAQDDSIYGPLVGRDFSWTSVVRYLPPGADEIKEFRRTVAFLEDREIPEWEWLFKRDITPTDKHIGVGGWVIGRGLIDQGLNVDMLMLTSLGMLLALPIFWAVFGSLSSTVLAASMFLLAGVVWTRGAMGLMPEMHERVYSLLVYASVIVQGTSFALHKISAFQSSTARDARQAWQEARKVDGMIATTAFIAIVGFATLWTFDLQPIRELGLGAAVGTAGLLLLTVVMTPAVGLLAGVRPFGRRASQQNRLALVIQRRLDALVTSCIRIVMWLATGPRPWVLIAVLSGLFLTVAVLFHSGGILSYTRPVKFLRGTFLEQSADLLNQPGQPGFSGLGILVEPAQGGDGKNPRFLQRAWELQAALGKLPRVREVSSVLSTLHTIAQESWKKPFPETPEEVDAAFVLLESRQASTVQRYLYYPGGVRISLSFGDEPSTAVGELIQSILTLARLDFPELKVNTFGRATLYPAVDTYIREGKVSNVFTSQILIAVLCGVLLYWRNRRLTTQYLCPIRGGVVMAVPLFFSTMVIGMLMWMLKIPLDMATAAIGALAINAATDFSLYFAMTYQRALASLSPLEALHSAMREEGRVIVADCLLNTVCFMPLVTSHFLPVQGVGWMMGILLITCALGTLLFMAALLPRCVVVRAQA